MRYFVLTIALLGISTALAATEPAWHEESRDIHATWTSSQFTVESTRTSPQGDDLLQMEYQLQGHAFFFRFQEFAPHAGNASFALTFESVVEFQDRNQNGRYDVGDPIQQFIPFDDLRGSHISMNKISEDRYEATAHYGFPGTFRGGLELSFLMTGETDLGEGPIFAPLSSQITIRMDDFPLQTDNQTKLALLARWDGPFERENAQVSWTEDPYRFEHNWGNVEADGTPRMVNASLEGYDAQGPQSLLVFSFDPAESLSWQHNVGLARADPQSIPEQILDEISGRWYLYALGLVLAGAVIATPLFREED